MLAVQYFDKDDIIIAGNGLYEQAQQLGLKVRVVESDGKELIAIQCTDIEGKHSDGVIGACDTADKGDDDFCAPFAKVFISRYFITDVIFTKDPVEITEPREYLNEYNGKRTRRKTSVPSLRVWENLLIFFHKKSKSSKYRLIHSSHNRGV
nr:hypothetical protein [Phocaeicola paurosaccharolyticus]